MAAMSVSPADLLGYGITSGVPHVGAQSLQRVYREEESSKLYTLEGTAAEELLTRSTRVVCSRHKITYVQLTCLQRKFLTHYRCSNCGMLPLYLINLSHIKRVRCRKCGDLISFKRTGKYGKLRKEVAIELAREIEGDFCHVM